VNPARVPSWCLRLARELDTADVRARALVNGLTTAQLNWKPRPEVWSVGQCLEHLAIANEMYVEAMARSLGGHPSGPVDEITPGWFGRWFIRAYIEPTTQERRARAPRKIAPVAEQVDASILDRFVESNAGARELVSRAAAHDVNRVRFGNPFLPLIRFTVGTGLQIVARHNHRHLLQAERVRQLGEFPRVDAAVDRPDAQRVDAMPRTSLPS
jgi:hypothetical protein